MTCLGDKNSAPRHLAKSQSSRMDDITAYYHPPPPGLHSYYHHHLSAAAAPPPPSQTLAPPPPPHHISVLPHDPYQFHHHLPNPPLDPFAYAASSSPLPHAPDEVRTLFVAGLPDDVKPREIYNLFREFPGYESSNLRLSGGRDSQPIAFAVFSDQQSAVAAMHAINGIVFDLEKGSTLYIDLAKSNSRSKRSRTDDDGPGSHKKSRGSSSFTRASIDPGVGSYHIPGMSNSAHNMIGYSTALRNIDEAGVPELNYNLATAAPRSNPLCPTLFVANLGPRTNEKELIQVFSRCHGFIKLKVQSNYGTRVAFVDFKDTARSTEALNQLQGAILYSSAGEGMRIEYAKARMGMRKKPK